MREVGVATPHPCSALPKLFASVPASANSSQSTNPWVYPLLFLVGSTSRGNALPPQPLVSVVQRRRCQWRL